MQELDSRGIYIVGRGGLVLPYKSQVGEFVKTPDDLNNIVFDPKGSLIGMLPLSRTIPTQPNDGNLIYTAFNPGLSTTLIDSPPIGTDRIDYENRNRDILLERSMEVTKKLIKIFDSVTPNTVWRQNKTSRIPPARTPEEAYAKAIALLALKEAEISPDLFDPATPWLPKWEADKSNTYPLKVALGVTNSLGSVGVIARTAREGPTDDNKMQTSRAGFAGNFNTPIKEAIRSDGPALLQVGACATSLLQLDLAYLNLITGRADLALVGAFDLASDPFYPYILSNSLAYGDYLQYLNNPEESVRPGDKNVKGMTVTEGGCCFVVATGATIYRLRIPREKVVARIVGIATDQDAARFVPPNPPHALPVVQRQAIENAGLQPHQIDVVTIHGTGTLSGDLHDFQTQRVVFSRPNREFNDPRDLDESSGPWFMAPKSHTAHTFAGSGFLSIVSMNESMRTQKIPATRNVDDPHGIVFNLVRRANKPRKIRYCEVAAYGVAGEAGAAVFEDINH